MVKLAEESTLENIQEVSRILLSSFMEQVLTKHLELHCDQDGALYVQKKGKSEIYSVREGCTAKELIRVKERKVLEKFPNLAWGKKVVKGSFVPNTNFTREVKPEVRVQCSLPIFQNFTILTNDPLPLHQPVHVGKGLMDYVFIRLGLYDLEFFFKKLNFDKRHIDAVPELMYRLGLQVVAAKQQKLQEKQQSKVTARLLVV